MSTISYEIQKRKEAVYNLTKNNESVLIKRLLQPIKKNIQILNMTERNSQLNGVNSAVASLEGFLDEINSQKKAVKDSSAAISMNLSKTHSPNGKMSPEIMIKPLPEDILSSVQNEDLPIIDSWHTKSQKCLSKNGETNISEIYLKNPRNSKAPIPGFQKSQKLYGLHSSGLKNKELQTKIIPKLKK